MTPETTWKDVIADALQQLGGEAHLKQIIEIALKHPRAKGNNNVDAKVRQVVRSYKIFEPVDSGSGHYRLLAPTILPIVGAPQIALDLTQTETINPKLSSPKFRRPKRLPIRFRGNCFISDGFTGFILTRRPPTRPKVSSTANHFPIW